MVGKTRGYKHFTHWFNVTRFRLSFFSSSATFFHSFLMSIKAWKPLGPTSEVVILSSNDIHLLLQKSASIQHCLGSYIFRIIAAKIIVLIFSLVIIFHDFPTILRSSQPELAIRTIVQISLFKITCASDDPQVYFFRNSRKKI